MAGVVRKKHHYVYIIIDNFYNKYYIGCRSSKINPKKDLNNRYFSSSTDNTLKEGLKYRNGDFSFFIIDTFKNRDEAQQYEYNLLRKNSANINPKFYNKALTPANKFSENFSVFDTIQEKYISINSEQYRKEKSRYITWCDGKVISKNKETGEIKQVSTEEFRNNKHLVHVTKGRKIEESERKIRSESSMGKLNSFYGKSHSKESMIKMVNTRRKNGNGDYHNGKNPLCDSVIIEKCMKSRKENGKGHGKCFAHKGKDYDSVPNFLKEFPTISPKKFRRFLKDNNDKLNSKIISLFLWIDSLEKIIESTKNKKGLYRDKINTKYGVIRVYRYWEDIKECIRCQE